ncbi:MAG: flagellar hook-length control protein FliK [Oscillospiraceae bacterium]|nr:flagellar hook-length control protein FliK [Oscillospiraceae bacterium]
MRIGSFVPPNNNNNAETAELTGRGDLDAPPETSAEGEEAVSRQGGRPLRATIDRAVNISEVVKAFQLPDTPSVRGLVAEMARGGVEINQQNLSILSRAVDAGLAPEQAVFMAREGIPINAANIERFQLFLEHKNLVGEQLSQILEQLPEEIKQTVSEQQPTTQIVGRGIPDAPSVSAQPQSAQPLTTEQPIQTIQPQQIVQTPEQPPILQQQIPEKNIQTTQPQQPANSLQPQPSATVPNAPPTLEQPIQTAQPQQTTQTPEQPVQSAQSQTPEQPATVPVGRNAPGAPSIPAPSSTAQPAQILEQSIETAQPQQTTEQSTTSTVGRNAPGAPPIPAPSAPATPEQPSVITVEQKIISLFKKVDPKNPHKLPNELNARELARELDEVIETVRQKLPELEPSRREALAKAVNELEQSVKFLDNMNRFTPIVNIPLQWGGERTTAELYVFNDSKGGKKIDPQNATVFISLMTANTGRVETMIKVIGKSVECDFSVDSPDAVDLVRGEMHILYKLLDLQGYKLARTSAQVAEKTADILDVSKAREQQMSRYFFDRTV